MKRDDNTKTFNPLRIYLGGEGGIGKSRVIKAKQYVSKSWGSPNAVRTVAHTGKAAFIVNGETLHSFF